MSFLVSSTAIVMGTWAKILDQTEIDFCVGSDGAEVEFSIGGHHDGLQLTATKQALRNLLAKGGEALQAMEAAEHPTA